MDLGASSTRCSCRAPVAIAAAALLGRLLSGVAAVLAASGDAQAALSLPHGQILISIGDGQNWLTRIRPLTGHRINTTFPLGIADSPTGLVVDWRRDRIYMVDIDARVVAQQISTGAQFVVSASGPSSVGTGPALSTGELTLLGGGDLIQAGGTQVLRIDMPSGDRTVLSSNTVGGGPAFTDIDVSAMGPWPILYVDDYEFGVSDPRIFEVNLATGSRTEISGPGRGAGSALSPVRGMAREPAGTLVVSSSDGVGERVMRVDPATGDRVIVSDNIVGTGPAFCFLTDIAVEADGNIVLSDLDVGVFRVDPVTGDRTVVSGFTPETGPVGSGDGVISIVWSITVVPLPSLSLAGRGLLLLVLCAVGRAFISRPVHLATKGEALGTLKYRGPLP